MLMYKFSIVLEAEYFDCAITVPKKKTNNSDTENASQNREKIDLRMPIFFDSAGWGMSGPSTPRLIKEKKHVNIA